MLPFYPVQQRHPNLKKGSESALILILGSTSTTRLNDAGMTTA
jgi:hypothetical protein